VSWHRDIVWATAPLLDPLGVTPKVGPMTKGVKLPALSQKTRQGRGTPRRSNGGKGGPAPGSGGCDGAHQLIVTKNSSGSQRCGAPGRES
jgi:hypothetical protein